MAGRAGIGSEKSVRGLKPGKPRSSKKKRGNPPARTSRSGNGKKIR